MTGGFSYKDNEMLERWAVPVMFYIPDNYKQQPTMDTHRLVSHKDILPTIYHLAFSGFTYKNTGDNIFDASTANDSFVITQSSWVMGKAGVIHLHSEQSYLLDDNFFLQPQDKTEDLENMRKRANAWLFGMKWQICNELEK